MIEVKMDRLCYYFKMKRWEKVVVVIFAAVLLVILVFWSQLRWQRGQGDDAIQVDITDNVAKYGEVVSPISGTILDYIMIQAFVVKKVEDFKNVSLPATDYYSKDFIYRDILKWHFILFYFLISFLTKIISADWLWSIMTASSYVGLIVLVYWFLRKSKLSIVRSLPLCLLVMAHPVWNYSIRGQFYTDKLFLTLGFLLILVVVNKKVKLWHQIVLLLLLLTMIERIWMITAIFLIGYTVLNWGSLDRKRRFWQLSLAILLICYFFYITKIYINNSYYSSFLNWDRIIGFYATIRTNSVFFDNLLVFLFFNIPVLLLGIWSWKWMLIAMVMMLPNVFGSVGGAEKTGWSTHYHSMYFPFLVFAISDGYVNLLKKLKSNWWVLSLIVVVGAIFYAAIYPYVDSLDKLTFKKSMLRNNIIFYAVNELSDSRKESSGLVQTLTIHQKLRDSIPEGSIVSAPEYLFPPLYGNRKIYYYPLGMDDADYVVVWVRDIKSKPPKYYGIFSYLGVEETKKIDDYLSLRMKDSGYDVDHPILVGGDIVVIRRISKIK